MCLFLFVTCQKALATKDPGFLIRDFEARWDRINKPFWAAVYERDISPAELEAMLTIRGNVCTSSSCGTAGMCEEVCGVCTKHATSETQTKKIMAERAAARSLFDAEHSTMPQRERNQLFYNQNPSYQGMSDSKPKPTTRPAALLYIFNNQAKIALPFSIV